MPNSVRELPYEGAKEMLLVDNVDSKEFLTSLFEAMYEEFPQPKKKKNDLFRFWGERMNFGDCFYHEKPNGGSHISDDDLAYEVLSVVAEIPKGKVATYGQIAQLIGRERNSRLVGKILSHSEYYGDYPCQRVVNHAGRLAPGWREQGDLLWAEGVDLKENGRVDLKKYGWDFQTAGW